MPLICCTSSDRPSSWRRCCSFWLRELGCCDLDNENAAGFIVTSFTRRDFLNNTWVAAGALAAGAAIAGPARAAGGSDRKPIYKEIERRHDESVKRLQEWIGVGSIAAENVGMAQGCDMMRRLALDAGFQRAECMQTKGHPGVFATMDNGAKRTLGLYFMYDVKQVNPQEWSSPPWEARLVDMPERGKVVMGRGAVNQKGPQASFLAALHAIRGAGRKIPVNLVLVAEG